MMILSMMLMLLILYVVRFVFFIFFFKHKTAYDMRISDWSSDVCSSDLAARGLARHRAAGALDPCRTVDAAARDRRAEAGRRHPHQPAGRTAFAGGADDFRRRHARRGQWQRRHPDQVQIGRESCRDRGWQYVLISVGAVSLKNKTQITKRNN